MLHLILATPEGEVYNKEVKKVNLDTTTGEIGILGGHELLLTTVHVGKINIDEVDDKRETYAIYNGVVNVENVKGKTIVRVLLESTENVQSLDADLLHAAVERAKISNKEKIDDDFDMTGELFRDMNKLKLARRYGRIT
jgi:F-type H+-transporting ATPase subunit epsilon